MNRYGKFGGKIAYAYAKRAEQDDLPEAQIALGFLYEKGLNGPADKSRASFWYEKAMDTAPDSSPVHRDAKALLEQLQPALGGTAQAERGLERKDSWNCCGVA